MRQRRRMCLPGKENKNLTGKTNRSVLKFFRCLFLVYFSRNKPETQKVLVILRRK
jgi:hypothetical protein